MRFNVSRPQFNKLSKGQSINLSHGALREGGDMSGRGFAVDLAQGLEKKINTAIRNNKGIRVRPQDVSVNGGSILGSISSAFKSAGNTIKKTATKAGDAIKKSANQTESQLRKTANQTGSQIRKTAIQTGDKIMDTADDLGITDFVKMSSAQVKKTTDAIITDLKKNSGKRMEQIAKYVPREYAETALAAALRVPLLVVVGDPVASTMASTAALTITDAAYDHDFEQAWTSEANKQSLINSLKESAQASVNRAINSSIDAGTTSLVQSGIRSDNQRRHDAVSAEAKMMGLGFLSSAKKGFSAVKKAGKKVSKSSIAKELGSVATPILKDMAHEEINKRNNQMLERYGDNRLNDALIRKSSDIAHRRVQGKGLRGGNIMDGSYTDLPDVGSDTRGLNFLANFQSMGLRDQNQTDSFTDFAEGRSNMSGMGLRGSGFAYAHGRGLKGDGMNGGNILASLASLSQGRGLDGKGLTGKGRFAKGSLEAKAWGKKMQELRKKKKE